MDERRGDHPVPVGRGRPAAGACAARALPVPATERVARDGRVVAAAGGPPAGHGPHASEEGRGASADTSAVGASRAGPEANRDAAERHPRVAVAPPRYGEPVSSDEVEPGRRRPPAVDLPEVERHASWSELFFDLVAVAAVASLAHLLATELDWASLGSVCRALPRGVARLDHVHALRQRRGQPHPCAAAAHRDVRARRDGRVGAGRGAHAAGRRPRGARGHRVRGGVHRHPGLRGAVVAARRGAARLPGGPAHLRGAALGRLAVDPPAGDRRALGAGRRARPLAGARRVGRRHARALLEPDGPAHRTRGQGPGPLRRSGRSARRTTAA